VQAGVPFADHPPSDLGPQDLAIDALLGIGAARPPAGRMAEWLALMQAGAAPSWPSMCPPAWTPTAAGCKPRIL
jgi:NAD(P)H-hydrate repair Nnr-like enzyme with NAD(P)H-hydrate epimerase domain